MGLKKHHYNSYREAPEFSFDSKEIILNRVNARLSRAHEENRASVINDFVNQNKAVTGNQEPAFRYRGDMYYHTICNSDGFPEDFRVPRLAKQFEVEFQAHCDQWEAFSLRQGVARGVIAAALNAMVSTRDLYNLLPEVVHEYLERVVSATGNEYITPEGIQHFQLEHEHALKILKMQCVLLLMKD